jgi:hypothetical protein
MKEKYSYVHIDATGRILKKLCEQKQSLLYAIIFKDGNDPNDTIPLAHAILADNTVPSIAYFFGNLVYNIKEVKSKLILPSFFVIDFSAALMNAILQVFNEQNINAHLNRCWNVLSGKYNTQQLRSSSFIHLCCCHVIHAIARSLTAARIDKKIRRGVLHGLPETPRSKTCKKFPPPPQIHRFHPFELKFLLWVDGPNWVGRFFLKTSKYLRLENENNECLVTSTLFLRTTC